MRDNMVGIRCFEFPWKAIEFSNFVSRDQKSKQDQNAIQLFHPVFSSLVFRQNNIPCHDISCISFVRLLLYLRFTLFRSDFDCAVVPAVVPAAVMSLQDIHILYLSQCVTSNR